MDDATGPTSANFAGHGFLPCFQDYPRRGFREVIGQCKPDRELEFQPLRASSWWWWVP
jgi:hypothetical protein